jgi:hypothetical protein
MSNTTASASEPAPTKTCSKCLETHELAKFGRDSNQRDGLYVHCRSCLRAHDQLRWQSRIVRANRQTDQRRWGQEVADFGEPLTVERIDDLLVMQQGRCVYCTALMVYGLGIDRRTHPRAVTIERVDNDVPHVITNCVLACHACNSKRMASYTYEEFMEHHADIKLNLVKKCQHECQQMLPITSFGKLGKGYGPSCKSCRNQRDRQRHRAAKPY